MTKASFFFPFLVIVMFHGGIVSCSSTDENERTPSAAPQCDLSSLVYEETARATSGSVESWLDLYSPDAIFIMNGETQDLSYLLDVSKMKYLSQFARIKDRRFYTHSVGKVDTNVATGTFVEAWVFDDGLEPTELTAHEHVLYTVNEDCKIVKSEQIVDKTEQRAIFSRIEGILSKYQPPIEDEKKDL